MNTLKPCRIALCIPAYNAAETLPRLFESVYKQTEAFDEVWLYDDASSDNTAALASELGAQVIRGQKNIGCSGGKNALLSLITSEWVHFHDADDALNPEFVARAKKRIANSEFNVLLFDYEQVDEKSGRRMSRSDFSNTSILENPVRYMLRETVNNGGVYSTSLLRSIDGFDADPTVQFNEDRAFHLLLAEQGARFAVEPYIGSRFYFSKKSMSSGNAARCVLAVHEITKKFVEKNPNLYKEDVAIISWKNAAVLASYLEWNYADDCVRLAVNSAGRIPKEGGNTFKILCAINGRAAIRIREMFIRYLKPRYRECRDFVES